MSKSVLLKTLFFWRPALNSAALCEETNVRFKADKEIVELRSMIYSVVACVAVSYAFNLSLFFVAPPLILTTIYLIPVFKNFEKWRTTQVLDQLAVRVFDRSEKIPDDAMTYATMSPSAGRLLLKTPSAMNKESVTLKSNFAETVLSEFKTCGDFRKKEKLRNVLKVLIDAGTFRKGQINHRLLPILLQNELEYRNLIVYALEKEVLDRNDFTEEMIRMLWSEVRDHKNEEIAGLLLQKNFSVDIENFAGESLLLESIVKNDISQVCFLLKFKAQWPNNNSEVTVRKSIDGIETVQKMFINKYLYDKPLLRRAFAQREEFEQNEQNFAGGFKSFSLDTFKINYTNLACRVSILALAAIAIIKILAVTAGGLPALTFCAIAVFAGILYNRWEWNRTVKAIRESALKEFSNSFPSNNTLACLVSNPSILQELLESSPESLFKFDGKGKTLLDHYCKYNESPEDPNKLLLLNILADKYFSNEAPISHQEKCGYFLKFLKHKQCGLVNRLLETGKIHADDFEGSSQFECWRMARDPETTRLLLKHGFDLNARSYEGWTPLLWNLFKGHSYLTIKALLESGADINAKIVFKGIKKGVFDLTGNRAIYGLLQQAG